MIWTGLDFRLNDVLVRFHNIIDRTMINFYINPRVILLIYGVCFSGCLSVSWMRFEMH